MQTAKRNHSIPAGMAIMKRIPPSKRWGGGEKAPPTSAPAHGRRECAMPQKACHFLNRYTETHHMARRARTYDSVPQK